MTPMLVHYHPHIALRSEIEKTYTMIISLLAERIALQRPPPALTPSYDRDPVHRL